MAKEDKDTVILTGDEIPEKHYTIENNEDIVDDVDDEINIPDTTDVIDLSKEDKKRLVDQLKAYEDKIKAERSIAKYDDWLDSMQAQYDGVVENILSCKTRFNIHRDVTKSHCKNIVNSIIYSIFNTKPLFAVAARPEAFTKKNAQDSARKIQQHLAYAHDPKGGNDIDLKTPAILAATSAVIKYVGILKLQYDPKIKTRRYMESFDGSIKKSVPVYSKDPILNQITPDSIDALSSDTEIVYNDGIFRFLQAHPEEPVEEAQKKRYNAYINKLRKGQKISVVIEEEQIVDNHPQWEFIDNKNFLVMKNTNGYKGLCEAEYIGEVREYSYKQLKAEEEKRLFSNVDEIIGLKVEGNDIKDDEEKLKYLVQSYQVYEETTLFKPEKHKKEIKLKCWRYCNGTENSLLGVEYYPFYGFDCEYVPLYASKESDCFWECKSIANDLKSSNIAQDLFINKFLEYIDNCMTDTPIVREDNDMLLKQFLMGELVNGMPWLTAGDPKEIDFVANHRTPVDVRSGMTFLELLERDDAKRTGVNEIRTGAESTLDPSAPGNKIRYLQEQANQNITPYISVFLDTFVIVPMLEIKLYDQISEEPLKFFINPNPDEISEGEGNPYDELTREDMRTAVNFHTEALNTYTDGQQRFQKTMILAQALFSMFPEIVQNPDARREIAEELIRSGGTVWENRCSKVYPSKEDMQAKELQMFIQGLEAYRQLISQQQMQTGQPAEVDPQAVLQAGIMAVKQMYAGVQKNG